MRRNPGKSGFTLVEMMTSLSILFVVIGGLATFFLGAHRLAKGAYAEAELSIQLRMLREKLLFHVAPPHGGNVWAGLLSGSSINGAQVVENSYKVRMAANGISTSTGAACAQTIELVPRTQAASDGSTLRWIGNDGDRVDDQWQRPYLRQVESYLPTSWLDASVLDTRHVFYITLAASMNGYARSERIAVPVFGSVTRGGFNGD